MQNLAPADFSGEKLLREGKWVVAFGADWCPYCRDFRKRYELREPALGGNVAWVDVSDTDNPLWNSFHLDIIPTMMVFQDGDQSWRRDGKSMKGLTNQDLDDLLAASK